MSKTVPATNIFPPRAPVDQDTIVLPTTAESASSVPSIAYLVAISPPGPSLGRRYAVSDEPVVIGRDVVSAIVAGECSVSRTHAQVNRLADGSFCVTDLRSTNGTFINDIPVSTGFLTDGDYLRCGSCVYRFLASGNVEADYHEELHRLSVLDPLTGLHNRRYLSEWLGLEVDRCIRLNRPLSVMLFDIDYFKSVNDRFGHLAGDATLCGLAAQLVSLTRKNELLARYGGEEFALVMPETDLERAVTCGERLRQAVAEAPFEWNGQCYPLTVSIGVGTLPAGGRSSPEELLTQADCRLYEAKRAGRNCVSPAARIGSPNASSCVLMKPSFANPKPG